MDSMPDLVTDTSNANDSETQCNTHDDDMSLDHVNNEALSDTDDEYDENGESEIEENEDSPIQMTTLCLFCTDTYESPCYLFCHMEKAHQFSMKSMACHCSFDQVSYIKYINYIRKEKPKPLLALSTKQQPWRKNDYLKPQIENDPLLMFDVEEFFEYTDADGSEEETEKVVALQATVDELREIVQRQREALRRLMEETHGGRELKAFKTVSDIDAEEDEGYFNSYAYFDIHHEMLSDKVRTEAYRDAILKNESLFRDRPVLDLGCGTGILSMFAAKVGARVVAIDMSEVIFHAMQIVKENGLEQSIDLRKGRLEDFHFKGKFDVIVSEWMGYFLLFEGMLDSVIYARDHYLSPKGTLLPNRCTLHLVAAEDMEAYGKYITFWDDVYGFKMGCMVKESIKEASTELIKKENIFTDNFILRDFDLMKVTPQDTEFTQTFSLIAERDASLTCFVGYFDTFFDLPHSVYFSTSPSAEPTHWKQTIFYLPQLKLIKKGEKLDGIISVRRKKREIRSLDVTITFDNKKFNYFVE